ncbi:MAG: H-type lectin domain-containing protein [Magnetococcales bacterium]|nr:H-type lectin domain-containing protein [Magnetococcales bacterium]
MRPIVFVLFFLVFSTAIGVWVMNDPKQTFFKDDKKTAVTQQKDATDIPATTKTVKTIDATSKAITKLTERIQTLEENNSAILIKLEEKIAAQQSQLNTIAKTEQLRVENGVLQADKGSDNWKLANLFSKKRLFSKRIDFITPFKLPPKIILGITTIELLNEKTKLQTSASQIDNAGFTITLETKSDTRIGEVSVDWAAFGS